MEYMTTEEAASYLRVGRAVFYRDIASDASLPRMRVGKRVIYRKADLDAWAARRTVGGEQARG